jgi:hypothetical protein
MVIFPLLLETVSENCWFMSVLLRHSTFYSPSSVVYEELPNDCTSG